jgi:hypothetical protein
MVLLDKDLSKWNVWTKATEMQIQEGDAGDFHPLVGVSMDYQIIRDHGRSN